MNDEMFLKDLQKEEDFIKHLPEHHKAKEELEKMLIVYDQYLDQFVRYRFDAEIYSTLLLGEPNNSEFQKEKGKADSGLRQMRIGLGIMRKQILQAVKGVKHGE